MITDHVWRPPPRYDAGGECAFMNCRRPRSEHADRVVVATPAPVLITQHVWRAVAVQRTSARLPAMLARPCEYMACRLPRENHARSVALDGRKGL